MRSLQIVMVLAVVPFTIATAQSHGAVWPLDSGSRVRIQAPIFSGQEQQATVLRTDGDTLHFQPWRGTGSNSVGLHDITRLEVHQGTHGRKLKGALIGFALVGGVTAAVTAATWKRSPGLGMDFGQGGDAAFAGLFAGIAGGVVGLVVGSFETDTWAPVKLPNRN
ncbi:MAG TPA: hypothetical protein VIM36_01620 [Gemmatimonadaceae bacterium]|jgi:hypothetical protein